VTEAAIDPPGLGEMISLPQESLDGFRQAEQELQRVRERFPLAPDSDERARLAAHALDQTERELKLASEHRRKLDAVEQRLWARRNRLEKFLIQARGSDWWHARRSGDGNHSPMPASLGDQLAEGAMLAPSGVEVLR
jgi:hypothetical protein